MDTLKVCISRIITSLTKRFKSSLHKSTYATAKYCLLTKQIRLCLSAECCLQNTGSCTTNCQSVSKCFFLSLAGSILMYGNQTWNSFACLILTSYRMTRSLWSNHRNIDICRWNNLIKVNVETMSKHQHVTCFKIRLNRLLIKSGLLLIINENHNNICLLCCLCRRIYLKALFFCSLPRLRSLIQTDNHMTAGLLCIQRMRMSLTTITNDSNCLSIQCCQITVILIINSCF